MHIHIVPNRQSTPTVLLRESFRQDGKIKKRTLANLSSLPANQIELIRAVLRRRSGAGNRRLRDHPVAGAWPCPGRHGRNEAARNS
jgi:hypothetical protein